MLHQVGIERQDHERQVRIDDADVHRQVGVEYLQRLVDQPHAHQRAVEQAVVAEDAHPGVDADQDRGPGRHHDQQQQHGLRFLAGPGDGVGHRVTDQQAHQGAEEGDLQRAQIGRQVQLVLVEDQVVAQVEDELQLVVRPGVDLRVRRDRHVGFGEADLQHDGEGHQEEQEQPEERYPDDEMPAGWQQVAQFGNFHDRSTTPLSSSHQTNTSSSQVGRAPRRSALATKDWTTVPLGSLT
ncbi:hypothetical protein D9M71_513840 [compost metagenome]